MVSGRGSFSGTHSFLDAGLPRCFAFLRRIRVKNETFGFSLLSEEENDVSAVGSSLDDVCQLLLRLLFTDEVGCASSSSRDLIVFVSTSFEP
jgi:hypothetical protein